MTEPRRHDTDPRPPYAAGPGADPRPRHRTPGDGAYRHDSWSPRPGASPGSFGRDDGPARGALSRPDPELYLPDPYRPDDDPAFHVDETGLRPRHRDPGRKDPARRDPARRDGGRRGRERPDPGQPDPSWPGRDRREFSPPSPPSPAWPGRDRRDPGSPGPGRDRPLGPGRNRRDPGSSGPDPGSPGPGRRDRDRDRRGQRQPDPSWPGRDQGSPAPPSLGRGGPDLNGPDRSGAEPDRSGAEPTGPVRKAARPAALSESGTGLEDGPTELGRRRARAQERPSWRWGQMPGGRGALIVIAAAVIGTAATIGTHRGPGSLLGAFVVAGTLLAALAVRPRAVHLLIPVPALAYMMGAVTAGLIHQQSARPGSSGLTVSAAQWIANGFLTMTAATVLAVAITVIRWLLNRSARPTGPPPEPEPVFPARPTPRTVSPSGPDPASRAAPRPASGPASRREPPSWPWPEEPVTQGAPAARREPSPRTEPFTQPPRPSSRPGGPARQPQPSPRRPQPPRADPLRPPSWLDSPSDPGAPPFGGSRDLTAPGTA